MKTEQTEKSLKQSAELFEKIKKRTYFSGFAIGAFKIILAAFSGSVLLLIHAVYNIIKAYAMHYAVENRKGHDITMFYSGLLVIAASTVYLIYSIYIYTFGSDSSYHMYVALGIATLTCYELVVAIHGILAARKSKNIQRETTKYINLASALISVSLTQTAILSFTSTGDMSKYYAMGDAVFGFLAMIVGILMLIIAKNLQKS